MRIVKIVLIAVVVYVGLVAFFEAFVGVSQGGRETYMVITTFDGQGKPHERVVAPFNSQGKLYVGANHWPRAWYSQLIANPHVRATIAKQTHDYVAVPLRGEELTRIESEYRLPIWVRALTGFPPRRFVRLDPV